MFYLILLAALPSCVVGIANPLAGLPALNKVHHSWPLDMNISDPGNAEILHDYARITHAIPAGDLEYMPQAHALAAARIAIAANATVDLLYSPWLEDDSPFPRDAPPTYTGPEEAAEIKLYAQRLAAAKQWIEVEGGAVVGAVLLDQERWDAKPNATWAAAVTRKNNLYYNTTIAAFPSASVQLYGRGGIGRGATAAAARAPRAPRARARALRARAPRALKAATTATRATRATRCGCGPRPARSRCAWRRSGGSSCACATRST